MDLYRIVKVEADKEVALGESNTLSELANLAIELAQPPRAEEQIPGQGTLFDSFE